MTLGIALAATDADNYVDAIVARSRTVRELGVGAVWFGQRMDYDSPALAAIVGAARCPACRSAPRPSRSSDAIP